MQVVYLPMQNSYYDHRDFDGVNQTLQFQNVDRAG
jgi:hypothetical protein